MFPRLSSLAPAALALAVLAAWPGTQAEAAKGKVVTPSLSFAESYTLSLIHI